MQVATHAGIDLESLYSTQLDGRTKGLPGSTSGLEVRDLGQQGWNVLREDLPLPALVLRRSALAHNLRLMQSYCEANRVLLAPHGKTTMAPQLFAAQLEHGAWGITAASVEQLQVYRRYGIPRVMLANQLVGAPNIAYVVNELKSDPAFELIVWVDSARGVDLLASAARAAGLKRSIDVMLEVGYEGGRSGVRSRGAADAVAAAIAGAGAVIRLVGTAAFEGLLSFDGPSDASGRRATRELLANTAQTAVRLRNADLISGDPILSAGGSSGFDDAVDVFRREAPDATIILRSGCYITHDHGMNAHNSPLAEGNGPAAAEYGSLLPALELWSYVNSTPEPGLAILGFGRRDAPYDAGLPIPLRHVAAGGTTNDLGGRAEIVAMNDQHGYLRSEVEMSVGDRVVLGISHACTAFDKWRCIPVVDDDYDVVDAILTFF